jgi:hypothetical protein
LTVVIVVIVNVVAAGIVCGGVQLSLWLIALELVLDHVTISAISSIVSSIGNGVVIRHGLIVIVVVLVRFYLLGDLIIRGTFVISSQLLSNDCREKGYQKD